jgi:glyoxylase-like metal-dependent hydrolase (beta-lactamase superfamily II)
LRFKLYNTPDIKKNLKGGIKLKIGNYSVHPISWSDFSLDGGAMFGVVPKPLWSEKIVPYDDNSIPMKAKGLLLKGDNNKNILIDLGIGTKENEKFIKRYRCSNIKSPEQALEKVNLKPEQITDVILTHLHFDHSGGATVLEKSEPVPAFKNAKYYISENQWENALSKDARDNPSFFEKNFLPLEKNNQVVFTSEKSGDFSENIKLIFTNGHTPGQQHPLIYDEKTTLFYCGDIFPTSAHLMPRWVMAFDNFPETSMNEKKQLLEKAAHENWILFFEHDPYNDACTIEKKNNRFNISEYIELE